MPKDPYNIPNAIPFQNGAFNPQQSIPVQTSNVISTPSVSSGASFGAGGASQGVTDYNSQYQSYLDSIKQNPNFTTGEIKADIPQTVFNAQPVNLPTIDFSGNKTYQSYADLVNNSTNSNIQGLADTYNGANSQLDSEGRQLQTRTNNNLLDLAQTKAQSLGNVDRTYNQALGFNNRLYQDQGLQLTNGLRSSGALDSSANDINYTGSARNKVFQDFGQKQTQANDVHNQTLNDIDTSYTKSFNQVKTGLESELLKIANQKELNIREKAQKEQELKLSASKQLLDLKAQYDEYQSKVQAARAASSASARTSAGRSSGGSAGGFSPVDFSGLSNGNVLGAADVQGMIGGGTSAYMVPNQMQSIPGEWNNVSQSYNGYGTAPTAAAPLSKAPTSSAPMSFAPPMSTNKTNPLLSSVAPGVVPISRKY